MSCFLLSSDRWNRFFFFPACRSFLDFTTGCTSHRGALREHQDYRDDDAHDGFAYHETRRYHECV